MFRIGIVGSDNSHADAFSRAINQPDAYTGEYAYPDMRVTSIYGLDAARTRQAAEYGGIERIVECPSDLIDTVDAVMVVFRHGGLHLKYALPFIERGIPVWIDKPLAISNADARAIILAARKSGSLLTGGSTCKHCLDVQMLKNAAGGSSRVGAIKAAMVTFPATVENEYGGLHFYGAHLAEMTMEAFGYDARAVLAHEHLGNVVATVVYDRYQVVMNFIPDSDVYYAVVFGEKGAIVREIEDSPMVYRLGLDKFAEMLRTRKPPLPPEHLWAPVSLLNAVVESYQTGRLVELEPF